MEVDGVVLNLGYIESARFAVLPFAYEGPGSRDVVDVVLDFCRVFLPYLDGVAEQKGLERPEPGDEWEEDLTKDHYTDCLDEMMKWTASDMFTSSFEVEIEGERYDYWGWCFERHGWNALFVPKRFIQFESAGALFANFDPEKHTAEYVRAYKGSDDEFVVAIRSACNGS